MSLGPHARSAALKRIFERGCAGWRLLQRSTKDCTSEYWSGRNGCRRNRRLEAAGLGRASLVPVMQSPDLRNLDHVSILGRLHGTRLRRVLLQGQVTPGLVIIAEVLPDDST